MNSGALRHFVTLDVPNGSNGYLPLDPPDWWCASIGEPSGQATFVGRYHPGITTATRIHFPGTGGGGLSYRERVIADGASNYWRLNEKAGAVALDIIGGATGTISGGVTLGAAGAIGDGDKAMTFDGTTGKIVTVASVPLPLLCTIEVWLKCPAATGAAQPIFDTRGTGSGDTLTLAVTPEGSGNLYSTTAGSTTAGPLVGSQWHHWIAVLSGATCEFYIDGQVDTVGATPQVRTVPSSGPAKIGVDQFSQYYSGALDEVAIYPRALTAPEIKAHYDIATHATASRTFHVDSIINRQDRNAELVLSCREVFD